jgi:hypothetical protein
MQIRITQNSYIQTVKYQDKKKILKVARKKVPRRSNKPSSRIFSRILTGKETMRKYIRNVKRKNFQKRILYPKRQSFRNEREIMTLPDKNKGVYYY